MAQTLVSKYGLLKLTHFISSDHIFLVFGKIYFTSFDHIFWFMGLGQFLSVLDLRSSDHHKLHQPVKLIWPHLPVSLKSTRLRGLCASSLVCLCHGSVYCASICASVSACQKCASMPEGHPRSVWASLDVPWGSLRFQRSQMSWRPRHCATVPDGSKPTRLYLWHVILLEMMIFVLFYLSCDGLLAVGTAKESCISM